MGQKYQFQPKTAKFRPKKSNLKFFWAFFTRPKNQFLWQKSEKIKEEFGRNGPKRAFFAKIDQILAKKSKTRIFAQNFFSPFFKRPKKQFLCQKSEKFKVAFGRKGPKRPFLAKKWPNFDQKRSKSRKREFLPGYFFRHILKDQKISSYAKNQKNLK